MFKVTFEYCGIMLCKEQARLGVISLVFIADERVDEWVGNFVQFFSMANERMNESVACFFNFYR
jgi:hypothetical protein